MTPKPAEEQAPWRRILVDVKSEVAEAVSAVLLEEGALGLELDDDETRAMPGRALAPTGRTTVLGTFSREPGLEARVAGALTNIAQYLEAAADMEIEWADLWPEDWNAAFKAEWKPLSLTERIQIIPTWMRDEPVPAGKLPIYLDPGLAFGTGTHETTRLCSEALDELLRARPIEQLLDVGTGTGILSIVALKLGAKEARGTEIDPVALKAARENADDNDVGDRFVDSMELPDHWGARHDVVVANILAEPLLQLAPRIAGAVKKGGRLMLSGLLEDQAEAIRKAYEKEGLRFVGKASKNGWVRLDFDG